jgi:hypothetical protein
MIGDPPGQAPAQFPALLSNNFLTNSSKATAGCYT